MASDPSHFAAWMTLVGTLAGVGLSGVIGTHRDARRREDDREAQRLTHAHDCEMQRLRHEHEQELRYNAERIAAYVDFTTATRMFCIKAAIWAEGNSQGPLVKYPDPDVDNCFKWFIRALVLAKPPLVDKLKEARDLFVELVGVDRHSADSVRRLSHALLARLNAVDQAVKSELGIDQPESNG